MDDSGSSGKVTGVATIEPLAPLLPLLRALPLPALLFRLDGVVAGSSAAVENLVGESVEGMTTPELADRLNATNPLGQSLGIDDLRQALQREANPEIAVDIRDRHGRCHAMIATGAVVESGGEPVGIVVLFTDLTGLIESTRSTRG